MSITIGHSTFDRVRYDEGADVLYLHVGDPATAVDFGESAEGHALRYDDAGRLVGVTIIHAKGLLERDGHVTITIPEPTPVEIPGEELASAIAET
jgi:uncharacterized protein YuzE